MMLPAPTSPEFWLIVLWVYAVIAIAEHPALAQQLPPEEVDPAACGGRSGIETHDHHHERGNRSANHTR